jgi:hypothetical protein
MKMDWKKPELEVLDIQLTMKDFGPPKQNQEGQGNNGNHYGHDHGHAGFDS